MHAGDRETCDECGFDSAAWRMRDAASFLDALGEWWALATNGIDEATLNARPQPDVWSPLEYGLHSALVVAVHHEMIAKGFEPSGRLPDATADDEPLPLDRAAILNDLQREGSRLALLARNIPEPSAEILHACHDASHHQYDVARALSQSVGEGRVVQVNASDGGVPKHSIGAGGPVRVAYDGIEGDRQKDRKHHGRPFQALCLWSAEVIDELNAHGHPIAPGSAGENITIAGLDWSSLRPGTLLRIGTALAEVSFDATPCAKQSRWFSDGDFRRISIEENPQWVRWYAWVRQPGAVQEGDEVSARVSR